MIEPRRPEPPPGRLPVPRAAPAPPAPEAAAPFWAVDTPRARLITLAVVIAIWTALPLLTSLQTAIFRAYTGREVIWGEFVPLRLLDWYTCAVFTPAYFWLVRRWPIDRRHWRVGLPVHLAATSVFVVVKYAAFVEAARVLAPGEEWSLGRTLAGSFISESIAFWAMLGTVHAVEFYRRWHEREVQAVRLQSELTAARLDALQAQLNPHFLFNTLHGVSALMRRDVDAADDMLAHLGDLLHRTLSGGEAHEVPLREELELLGLYLRIVETRFGDRLTVSLRVEEGLDDALVPRFFLQPLVENALEHGIARRGGAGRVEIGARRGPGATLEITVADDGPGLAAGGGAREGIGLSNTRRRLAQLYGPAQSLTLEAGRRGGLRVRLVLPLRREGAEAASPLAATAGA